MSKKKARGLFISFEGGEGVGKSTQIELLASYLKKRSFEVVTTREPGGTSFAEKLRVLHKTEDITGVTELFLIEAARSDHVAKVIQPALKDSKIVICDRFGESTCVYQGYVRGLEIPLIKKMNRIATQGLQPDCIIWLDSEWKYIKKRLSERKGPRDRFDHEKESFHKKILAAYRRLARGQKRPKLHRLSANQPIEKIHQEILAILKPQLRDL